MPTSGLVLTAERPEMLAPILDAIGHEPSIEAASPIGSRIPLVLDTPNKATDKRYWDWLHSLPGVACVDVAFIYLGDRDSARGPSEEHSP